MLRALDCGLQLILLSYIIYNLVYGLTHTRQLFFFFFSFPSLILHALKKLITYPNHILHKHIHNIKNKQKKKSKTKKNLYPATPTTVAPMSSILAGSSSNKPIITTAPSQSPALTLPPLKQKTAIVKSKIPPPVPPRGSPKDRRSKKSDCNTTSPKGTPTSAGSYNYLNDKYFACSSSSRRKKTTTTKFKSNDQPPKFGEKRSPSCVRDWLEINDFNSPLAAAPIAGNNSNFSPPKEYLTRRFSNRDDITQSSIRVKSMVEHFSNQPHSMILNTSNDENVLVKDELPVSSTPNNDDCLANEIADLKRKDHVSQFLFYSSDENLKSHTKQLTHQKLLPSNNHKNDDGNGDGGIVDKNHEILLSNLKPKRRRKKSMAPLRPNKQISDKSKEKYQIIQSMSNVSIKSSDVNFDKIMDNFSFEGEFV